MQSLAQSDSWQLEHSLEHSLGQKQVVHHTYSSRILAKFKQVFPLKIIPDEIIIEELRIVWIKRDGLWADEVISIMSSDIACVDAAAGPFFGHVHIKSLTGGLEILIDKLHRKDAYQIRSLVEAIAMSARSGRILEDDNLQIEKDTLMEMGNIRID